MTAVGLNLIVIVVGVVGLWRGWSLGAARELVMLLGLGLAVLAVRLFGADLAEWLTGDGGMTRNPDRAVSVTWTAVTLIYCAITGLMAALTGPLGSMLSAIPPGPLSSIVGSVVSALRYLMLVSVLLNFWSAWDDRCLALRVGNGGDGGAVEEVMAIAPALTGAPDAFEMVHLRQLREARSISQNLTPSPRVAIYEAADARAALN